MTDCYHLFKTGFSITTLLRRKKYNHQQGGVLQLKLIKNKKVSQITVGRELIEALGELPVRQCFTV
jgi:hypothetical protein